MLHFIASVKLSLLVSPVMWLMCPRFKMMRDSKSFPRLLAFQVRIHNQLHFYMKYIFSRSSVFSCSCFCSSYLHLLSVSFSILPIVHCIALSEQICKSTTRGMKMKIIVPSHTSLLLCMKGITFWGNTYH